MRAFVFFAMKIFRGRSDMNAAAPAAAVVVLLYAVCFTRGIYATLESARNDEAVFDTLVGLIDAEIFQLTGLEYNRVEFRKPNSAGLERVFRNRFDLFLGVPREILTSGLDLEDRADFGILNTFFRERESPAAPQTNGNSSGPPPGGLTTPTNYANNTATDAIIKSDTLATTTAGRTASNADNFTVPVPSKVGGCPEYTTVVGVRDGPANATITGVSKPRGPRTIPDTTSRVRRPATTSLLPGATRAANKTVVDDNAVGNVRDDNNNGQTVPTSVRRSVAASITNRIGWSSSALSNEISYDYSNYGR